jgi:hypothetical protein
MSDHREAQGANEPTTATGVSMTKGGQRIAEEDELRRVYLDSTKPRYRRQAQRARINMRVVGRRRREMEPA